MSTSHDFPRGEKENESRRQGYAYMGQHPYQLQHLQQSAFIRSENNHTEETLVAIPETRNALNGTMKTFPKHLHSHRKKLTSEQRIAKYRTERERWNGLEGSKAYRFRNLGSLFRTRGA